MFCRRFHFIRVCWSNIGRNNGVHMFTCEKQTEARTHNQRAGSKYRKKKPCHLSNRENIPHSRVYVCVVCVCGCDAEEEKFCLLFIAAFFSSIFGQFSLSLSLFYRSYVARMLLLFFPAKWGGYDL